MAWYLVQYIRAMGHMHIPYTKAVKVSSTVRTPITPELKSTPLRKHWVAGRMLVCKCLVLSVTLPAISTMQAMQVNAPPIHTSMAASNAAVLRKEGEQPAGQQQWQDTFCTVQHTEVQ
jgi:hypothetical protein